MPILFGILFGLMPVTAYAFTFPNIAISQASFGPLCAATGICTTAGSGFAGLQLYLGNVVVPALRMIFIGMGVMYVAWYALNMIINGSEEAVLSEQRKAFGYAAMGMGVVGLSTLIVNMFDAGNTLVNPTLFATNTYIVIDLITMVAGVFIVFIVGLSGFRIIVLQGNESEIEKQKKNFFHGLIGVPVLLVGRTIVEAIVPGSGGRSTDVIDEVVGMTQFLLEMSAGLAVVAIMGSGVLFIFSMGNDNLKQRARRILLSTIIILILIMFSYTLVATFINK